jgi:phosphate uptake regulator
MKRKVIRQANQAYTITLPIDWVRKNKIDKNSEVDLAVNEKSLIINSENTDFGGSIKLDVSELSPRNIHEHLTALYARGYDEIEITSDKDISSIITSRLSSTIGFALVSQSKDKYIIRDISPSNYPNLDDIFKRVFQMLILFYDSAFSDIFGEQKETLENLKSRDIEINKFCLYLERAVNKSAYQNPVNSRILFAYSYMLEKISDEIERAWRTNIRYKPKKSKEVKELVSLSKQCLEKAFDLYYQFNPKIVDGIYSLREKVREISLKVKDKDPETIRFVRHNVKIAEDLADLNHLALIRKLD